MLELNRRHIPLFLLAFALAFGGNGVETAKGRKRTRADTANEAGPSTADNDNNNTAASRFPASSPHIGTRRVEAVAEPSTAEIVPIPDDEVGVAAQSRAAAAPELPAVGGDSMEIAEENPMALEPQLMSATNVEIIESKFLLNEAMHANNNPILSSPNDYPLSREQVGKDQSVAEMHQRLDRDLERKFPTSLRTIHAGKSFTDLWNDQLFAIRAEYTYNSKKASESLYRSKTMWQSSLAWIKCDNSRCLGLLEKMLEDLKKDRGTLLGEALKSAAQIQRWNFFNSFIGKADYTDLIELSLTMTNTEKEHISKHFKFDETNKINLDDYLEKMAEKNYVATNAAFSFILKLLLSMGNKEMVIVDGYYRDYDEQMRKMEPIRDQSFDVNGHLIEKEIERMGEFLCEDHIKHFERAGSILVKSNYVHLRHLFREIARSDRVKAHYKELQAPYKYTGLRGLLKGQIWSHHILKAVPEEMGTIYDLVKLKFLIAENSKDGQNLALWKLLKAIALEVEFGRPYFYADLLHEKLAKLRQTGLKKHWLNIPDIFNDLVRIVLTRGPIDLAYINQAFGTEMLMKGAMSWDANGPKPKDLYSALKATVKTFYPVDSSDATLTLKACLKLIKWAIRNDGRVEAGQVNSEEISQRPMQRPRIYY